MTFEAVVAEAVAQTRGVAEAELGELSRTLHGWLERLDGELAGLIAARLSALDGALFERVGHLATFNVVIFGRTGTGKSTLVEALTRGDGRRVSPDGRLDYTRDLFEIAWEGCTIVDTPGIEGWASHDERERIEALAHDAVQRADIVVLAFDDLNQKVKEFEQVARWVAGAGKAAIALLNVRDESWRFDEKLWPGDERELAAGKVRGHARHIHDMLVEVGLPDVPVVAISAQWALAARSRGLGEHPALLELLEALDLVGAEELERISNLPAVIELVVEALSRDAAGLRLGGVRAELRALLRGLERDLQPQLLALDAAIRTIEEQLFDVLAKTGVRPRGEFGAQPAALGGPTAPVGGDVGARAVRVLVPLLARVRNEGVRRLQDTLGWAFKDGVSVAPEQLSAAMLDRAALGGELQAAVTTVLAELREELRREAEDRASELRLDFAGLAGGFDATAGRGTKWLGRVGGGASAGLVFFGPVGIGLGVLGGIVAGRGRRRAERALRSERLRVERSAIAWLDWALTDARAVAIAATEDAAVRLGAEIGAPLAARAVALRGTRDVLRTILAEVGAARRPVARAQDVLGDARRVVEQRRHPGDLDAAAKTWLGEDWLDRSARPGQAEPAHFVRPALGGELELTLPTRAAAERWLELVAASLPGTDSAAWPPEGAAGEPGLAGAVPAADPRPAVSGRPTVVLAGDYSSGKTSLLRRLAAELGVPGADELEIGAGPTTDRTHVVAAPAFDLVDTPGLNSERAADERTAAESAASAALILVVHTIAGGDLTRIVELIAPPHAPGRAHRVVHVLARIDGLSARPHHDGAAFLSLLETKRRELRDRLHAAPSPLAAGGGDAGRSPGGALPVAADADGRDAGRMPCNALPMAADAGGRDAGRTPWNALPLPVAADPGGRHADRTPWTAADFDDSRGWDGVGDLLAVVERLAAHGQPAAAVDATLTRLDAIAASVRARLHADALEALQVERLRELYADAKRDHERVEARAEATLETLVDDLIVERMEELSGASARTLKQVHRNPRAWLVTPELEARFGTWRDDVNAAVADVYARLRSDLDARIGSRAFGEARAVATDSFLRDALGAGAKQAGRIPELARYVERFGLTIGRGVTTFASVALEAVVQLAERAAAKRHLTRHTQARTTLRAEGEAWVAQELPALLADVRRVRLEAIDAPLARQRAEEAELQARMAADERVLATITELMREGNDVLGG